MRTTDKPYDWKCRGSSPLSLEDEAELLTEILNARPAQQAALMSITRSKECKPLIRCAALDRYMTLVLEGAQKLIRRNQAPQPRNLRETNDFLLELGNFSKESNEDLRSAALQWYAQLLTDLPMATGAKDPEAAEKKWRKVLEDDPSPRIRWLASLGHPSWR